METMLTITDVMTILNVSKSTMQRLLKTAELGSYKIGRELRFKRSDVDAYIESCRVGAAFAERAELTGLEFTSRSGLRYKLESCEREPGRLAVWRLQESGEWKLAMRTEWHESLDEVLDEIDNLETTDKIFKDLIEGREADGVEIDMRAWRENWDLENPPQSKPPKLAGSAKEEGVSCFTKPPQGNT